MSEELLQGGKRRRLAEHRLGQQASGHSDHIQDPSLLPHFTAHPLTTGIVSSARQWVEFMTRSGAVCLNSNKNSRSGLERLQGLRHLLCTWLTPV